MNEHGFVDKDGMFNPWVAGHLAIHNGAGFIPAPMVGRHGVDLLVLIEAHAKLQAELTALKNAVCILEDGAEPEAGDAVKYTSKCDTWFSIGTTQGQINRWKLEKPTFRIYKRGGKPVIYKSELEGK